MFVNSREIRMEKSMEKNIGMNQSMLKGIRTFLIILTIILCCLGGFVYRFGYDMDHLGKGDLIQSVISPTEDYTLNIYLVNGGATVSYAIRGELQYNKSRRKAAPKNIYWHYKEDKADVEWLDNRTVMINGHTIDVLKERYDYRRDK